MYHEPRLSTRIALYVLHGLGIIACVIRLSYRKRTRRLWWDDFWAFSAMLSDVALLLTYGIRQALGHNPHARCVLGWILLTSFTFTIWASRLSIAITIVRLVPPGRGLFVAKSICVSLGVVMITLILQKLLVCQKLSGSLDIMMCQIPNATGIVELCSYLAADTWLICAPAYLLWHAKLNRRRQVVIFSVFACDIFLSVASVVHCVFIFRKHTNLVYLTAHFQMTVSLLVCNLLVPVTWLYSRIYPIDDDDDDSSSSSGALPTRRTQRPDNVPNPGFEGSVLVLTQLSDTSSSLLDSFDKSLTSSSSSSNRPRSQTLSALYPLNTLPCETLPPHLRPSRSSPALLYLTVPVVQNRLRNGYDLRWNSDKAWIPSLASSSDTDDLYPLSDGMLVVRERRMIQRGRPQGQDLMARIDER